MIGDNGNSLDMSVALFNSLALPSVGVFDISYEFV
jgi:hypothetical protein